MSDTRTRVLVLGGTGMLGHTLFERLSGRAELDVHATVRDPRPLDDRLDAEPRAAVHAGVDAAVPGAIERVVEEVRPDVVVNAIGVVKQVETAHDPATAIETNAVLPHRLARICSRAGARLVHISTDCVFSGSRGGYREDDPPDPPDRYGRSKLLGEPGGERALTLRTSIIGHELQTRHGLIEWFLAASGPVDGFRRAIFSGLPTVELARVIAEAVIPNPELTGLHHVSAAPISKLELLQHVALQYDKAVEIVPRDDPAIDRSLDSTRFREATGYRPAGWPQLVAAMHDDARVRYPTRFRQTAGL